MGSGSSCKEVKKFDKGNQMPSTSEPTLSVPSSLPKSALFERVTSKAVTWRSSVRDDVFELDNNMEDYSSIWDDDTKLSSTFQQSLKSGTNNREHHQNETFNQKWNKKNSTTFGSAHVESIVDTQTHSYINLSTSEKIDELMNNLNRVHTQLDEIIKRRTEQVSTETESVLSHILNETHQKQQRLLNFAKGRQSKQDENYQKVLQEYISQLDERKAKDLADLQQQLQIYRDHILQESQLKIITVNEQANLIKAKILKEEQQQAADKIDSIIAQIQKISTDGKHQPLGSEIITKTNIITNANVGTKPSGQDYSFNSEQNNSLQQRPLSNKKDKTTGKKDNL